MADNRLGHDGIGYATFSPRPDQLERYDMQESFFHCQTDGLAIMLGGNGAGTTTITCAKAARFLMETPPPRRDCPFWFIAKTYDQVTKVVWKEKLWLGGLIPSDMINWADATWYNSKQRLPHAIPLKPHENGNNWLLEFKSYEQGIGAMMASAIGGFVFVEQFPWPVLEEVLRGCREYNFPGSKLVEFTPVVPEQSLDLEELIENGKRPEVEADVIPGTRYMPDNWEVFYSNTECAMEAGHVSAEWYKEFFGMLTEDMRETRQYGRFASYEGVIYKNFNPATHCIGDDVWSRMNDQKHFRGIDWGSGPENAFVCLWGCRLSTGQWLIYDEYYSTDQSKTTVDHLCEIQLMHEWPDDVFHLQTVCDPSDPDNLRIAQQIKKYTKARTDDKEIKAMSIRRAVNSVLRGIEHIKYLMKPQILVNGRLEPKLLIHKGNCPQLVRQLRTYRWERGFDASGRMVKNPKNARPVPLKFNDHTCVVAETLVMMADGTEKPITDVMAGDLVVTHLGIGRVLVGGTFTGIKRVQKLTAGKIEVVATYDHRWYTADTGTYQQVHEGGRLWVVDQDQLKQQNGADTFGGDTRLQTRIRTEVISGEREEYRERSFITFCTRRFGKTFTAKFRKVCASITLMGMLATMLWRIFSFCRLPSTRRSIQRTGHERSMPQDHGILQTPEKHGIASMRSEWQGSKKQSQSDVSIAVSSTKVKPYRVPSIAQITAGSMPGRLEATTMKSGRAASAQVNSPSTDTAKNKRAESRAGGKAFGKTRPQVQDNARCAELPSPEEQRRKSVVLDVSESEMLKFHDAGVKPVYCLATEHGTAVFNGVLSAQCDALRYLCFSLDSADGLTVETVAHKHQADALRPEGNFDRWAHRGNSEE